MLEDEFREYETKSKRVIESLRRLLATIGTGRAAPALVEDIQIEVYGDKLPLRQLGSVNVPERQLIVIQPYDNSTLKAIEKALLRSDLGYSVNNDGRLIRVAVPRLTVEKRRELVKLFAMRCEEARVALRNCRRELNDVLRRRTNDRAITEDEYRNAIDRAISMLNQYVREVDACQQLKHDEIQDS